MFFVILFFFKQKTAYEMRISDWSSDVCSSDLAERRGQLHAPDFVGQQIFRIAAGHAERTHHARLAASHRIALQASKTFAATDERQQRDAIAGFYPLDASSRGNDLSLQFMTRNRAIVDRKSTRLNSSPKFT